MRLASLMALAALVTALAAAPHPASAQSIAYAVPGRTNVRAGPGTEYPVVARVHGGTELIVFGCLSDRAWCDIQVYDTRGWISSRRLEFVYAGSRVLVPDYYGYFDAPIISFNFGYWDRYYEDRPFYRRWRRHQPRFNEPGPATNWPGIEHPGGGHAYQGPPKGGGYQGPGPEGYLPPVTGGYEPPGVGGGNAYQGPPKGGGYQDPGPEGYQPPVTGGYEQPGVGGGGPGGPMPLGKCPPDIVCQ
jgi:uncharacterized protein YraI